MEDDWMNPQTSGFWTPRVHPDGTFYLISRKRRIPVSGNVSHIERWETWEEFDNREKRDKNLAELRKTTTWGLRADQVTYIGGHPMKTPDPRDLIDI